ncbi:bacillithiol biosynthesis cysteine-adding enzyme BshC [Alkalibacillus almallahensis]|uniref:bacillithiol biosynthesis cysteine-adding enzyme BshC n=1 Tax=Alkalibacillus almallahensis TaxID=1379154 RepID=UPI0014248BEF|nr:bacillithiol biosynthesis cysteine-adding enzyme BshC [Alkalibacillus almallahensis]NIK10690.1 bacillithiol biosynthesis cysteine-adding enzyme BshC [Alkalibacillus almallahensis]
MDVQSIKLDQSKLMQDYRDRKESIYQHFYYDPFQINNFKRRQDYITKQKYQRENLVEILKTQNRKWGMSDQVEKQIDTLLDPNASVVIGGQQTGLLTGPLYTIHKIVSIIIQAKEQQDYLKQPVIPVFWMAGEDHDFLEVDHVYTLDENELHKTRINDQTPFDVKLPLSKRELPKDTQAFVDRVFASFQETEHTKAVYDLVTQALLASDTYVDFFACFIQQLFQEEGLVLVDAADDDLRRMEKDYFIKIVDHQQEIATSVVNRLQELSKDDYHVSLDVTATDAHLFYHHEGERLLLEVDDSGDFVTKGGGARFTKESLKETIEASPEKFSNNVVTRPLMQECVFPVLSFVGGPGEIAYWAALKDAFVALDLQLPIVTPRLSLTLMKRNHQTLLNDYQINATDLINYGTYQDKMNWLKRQTQSPIDETVNEVKKQFTQDHKPLQDLAASISSDLHDLTQTNLDQIQEQINYIENRLMQAVKEKNQVTVNHFDTLDLFYRPEGGLQERIWNITYWLNEIGLSLPQELTKLPARWEQDHQLVYL